MTVLNDIAAYKRIDPHGMLASIRDLPRQCRAAWEEAQELELPPDYRDIDKVVILGMGGSAIGGDLLRSLVALESPVPIFSHRSYELPLLVDDRTLLIASSYSGGTEEVLSAFRQALPTEAKKVVITTGGDLLTTARANGIPSFVFQYEGEPRSALGYSIMPLLAIAGKAGLLGDKSEDVQETIAVMEALAERIDEAVPLADNSCKQLAQRLHDRLPVVYGAGILTEVAHRWKTQLNESSKVWCFYEELPEANHNAIIGYALPKGVASSAFVVFLRGPALHPRALLRYDFTRSALEEAGVESTVVDAEGKSPLAQMMSTVLFGDWLSLYLAMLYNVAPAPTTVIDELKEWLTKQSA
jgi:glucose/mannose-6-phosphate isomerase